MKYVKVRLFSSRQEANSVIMAYEDGDLRLVPNHS